MKFSSVLVLLLAYESAETIQAFAPTLSTKAEHQRQLGRFQATVSTDSSAEKAIVHREIYDAAAWSKGFQNVEEETCYELTDGDFPTDLKGTWFMNGHTKFYVTKDEFHLHPFDADGMVQAVTFNNGKAWFRNRYIQTPGYLQELKEGKICKRGVFGTAKNKGKWYSNIFDVDFKNVANTHVLFLADDELYALWEGGAPYQLNPTTLQTIGESDLYGALDGKENNRYAAHYKIDPRNQHVCGFSIAPGDGNPANSHNICVMEHKDKKLLYWKKFPFEGLGISHDCAVSENYFIFLQPKFIFDPVPLILGLKGASECMQYDESAKTANIVLIPRGDNDKEIITIEVPPYFSFHTSNAFEDDNGEVVLDMVVAKSDYKTFAGGAQDGSKKGYPVSPMWETLNWKTDVPPNSLLRVRLDPKTRTLVSETNLTEELATVEFPVANPSVMSKPYKYAFCATSATSQEMAPLQGLAKIDVECGKLLEKWLPEEDQYITELAFCPKQNAEREDEGYLLTYLLDSNKKENYVLIFDAEHPGKGPISSSKLNGWHVNHSLHGTFVPGFVPELSDDVQATFS